MTNDVIHHMEPLSSLAISVFANIATPWITKLFEKGVETRVKDAYVRALKRWTKHDDETRGQILFRGKRN